MVAIKMWAPHLADRLVHLFSDNANTVTIFQAGRARDKFIQACAREIWLMCASWYITLVIAHIPGAHLTHTAGTVSRMRTFS